ncbi:MAG: hypothetical protein ACE5JI_04645, partial [Acidobacteriota bacterium]
MSKSVIPALFLTVFYATVLGAEDEDSRGVTLEMLMQELQELREAQRDQRHTFDRLAKAIDDV